MIPLEISKLCCRGTCPPCHFRHAFISDVEHNQKGGAALARDLGGHKSVRITNTYLHTTEEERKEAVDHMGYAEVMAW